MSNITGNTATNATATTRGQLGRYALWQFADFVKQRGALILVLGSLCGWFMLLPLYRISNGNPQLLAVAATSWMKMFAPIFVVFAMARLVSVDRASGAFRFLFSKPISVVRFYTQLVAIHFVAYLACWLVLLGVAWACGVHIPFDVTLLNAAIIFIALGGLYFIASVLTTHDLMAATGVWIVSYIVYNVWGDDSGIKGTLVHILPPMHKLGALTRGGLGDFMSFDPSAAWWLVGYGLGCFLVGIVVLARKPLAAG